MSRIFLRSIALVAALALSSAHAEFFRVNWLIAADSAVSSSGSGAATPAKASPDTSKPAVAKARNPRVLVITTKNDLRCDTEMKHLRAGTFAKLRAAGWMIGDGPENMVQIVDRDTVPALAAKIDAK